MDLILKKFQSIFEAQNTVPFLDTKLNSLPDVKVRVDKGVSGTGQDSNPWKFRVTFLEPVGPLPLLNYDNVNILQDPAHFRIDIATAEYKQQIRHKLEQHIEL